MTSPDKTLVESDHHYLQRGDIEGRSSMHSSSKGTAPQHLSPNPASSPVPPGFAGGGSGSHTDAVVTTGEELRQSTGGALSSPPPPGFKSDNQVQGDRSRLASEILTTSSLSGARAGTTSKPGKHLSEHGYFNSSSGNQHHLEQRASGLLSGGVLTSEAAQAGGGRTSSFVNLAAVLGTGLAESMDDATKGEWSQHLRSRGSDEVQDLNLARQSRHAAARLIGASPPRVEPLLGLDITGSFLASAGGAPPASLGGAGMHLPSSSHRYQGNGSSPNIKNNIAARSGDLHGGYLSAAFANPHAEDDPEDLFGQQAARRGGSLPAPRDLGVTVIEPGSEQHRAISDKSGRAGMFYGSEDSGGVLAALMQEQQQIYCNDPQCHQQQSDLRPGERVGAQVRSYGDSGGVLEALMQEQQVYCSGPQCQQQQQPPTNQYRSYENQSRNSDRDTFETERGMRNLWLDDNGSTGHASRHSQSQQPHHYADRSVGNSSARSDGSQSSRQIAEADIRPFIWDTRLPQQRQVEYYQGQQQPGNVEPSRCLAILRAAHLQIPDIRSTCEAFGVVESFRSDFADRGVVFVSYFDIRSAQFAALELEAVLRRRDSNRGVNCVHDVAVYYCVPLNSSTQADESRLVLSDVPPFVDEHSLLSMLSSYGSVRSLKRQGGYYGGSSYEAEFHNIQDAKQALLELSSTQPWGPDVAVEVGMRPPIDRKRGRELLSVIGRWRHGNRSNISPTSSTGARAFEAPSRLNHGAPVFRGTESSASPSPAVAALTETQTQLVLGPDGRYSYMVVNNQSGYPHPPSDYNPPPRRRNQPDHIVDPSRQQIVHGPNGEIYITTALPPSNFRQSGPSTSRDYYPQPPHHHQYSNGPYHHGESRDRSGPYFSHQVIPSHPDHHGLQHHHHPHSSNASTASMGGDDKDNKHLVLDLDAVEHGRDIRTSLMVRNIPNKYTQQMLLAEFTENGLGPGVIDFFYLPIDFKNRCNRGYAFINFVDFKDILPFHQRYFGKHWSTFNSDKICDITYARIQGKAAMLKRFENSALMEKDEEYKPLVFISHGPEKGKRIPFPEAAAAANKP